MIFDLAVSPNGKSLAYCEQMQIEGNVRVVDLATFKEKYVIPQKTRVMFSPNGNLLATSGGRRVTLWEPTSGKEIYSLQLPMIPATICFSPDSWTLAIGCNNLPNTESRLVFWDLRKNEYRTFTDVQAPVRRLEFSPDGKILTCYKMDDTTFRDAITGKILGVAKNLALRPILLVGNSLRSADTTLVCSKPPV